VTESDLDEFDVELVVRLRLPALSAFEAKAVAANELRKRVRLRVIEIEPVSAERSSGG
jgi:hypothetical protein